MTSPIANAATNSMARNATWMFGGQAASFLIQAAYFVLLARLLGVTEYGIFAGAFALVSIVTPYSALGAGMLFMRYASRDRKLAPVYWGNSLLITAVISLLLGILFAFVGPYYTHIDSPLLFVVLVLANCLLSQIVVSAGLVFQSFEKMRITATLTTLSNLMRLAVLLFMKLLFIHATALQWAFGILIGTGMAATWSVYLVHKEIKRVTFSSHLAITRLWEGIGYSFAGSTQAIYNDLDKTMMSHYGMNAQNGPYTLAYRVVDFATAPIGAVDSVILPRFFLHGREEMGEVTRLAKKSLKRVVPMGVAIALLILVCSPIVPPLVGRGFTEVIPALRWLCLLPLLRGVHRVTGSALTGTGYQNVRTGSQFTVAAINLGLNIWLIPTYGWLGAAWSSVASDGLLAVLNTLILLEVRKRVLHRNRTRPH